MAVVNIQAKRRAASIGGVSWFSLPKPPRIPEATTRRFPELESYNQELDQWWNNVCNQMHLLMTGPDDRQG